MRAIRSLSLLLPLYLAVLLESLADENILLVYENICSRLWART